MGELSIGLSHEIFPNTASFSRIPSTMGTLHTLPGSDKKGKMVTGKTDGTHFYSERPPNNPSAYATRALLEWIGLCGVALETDRLLSQWTVVFGRGCSVVVRPLAPAAEDERQ